ncbi:MAG: hypothetical protein QXW00_03550 [Candidatus Woesearchaeota archaeon]
MKNFLKKGVQTKVFGETLFEATFSEFGVGADEPLQDGPVGAGILIEE